MESNFNMSYEEEEVMEDERRRRQELDHLLQTEFPEFSDDEENSFCALNEEGTLPNQSCYESQYMNATPNEQLPLLYDRRVKEVEFMNQELEKLKEELAQVKGQSAKAVEIVQREKEQSNISLNHAQILLANKVSEINTLKKEIEDLVARNGKLEDQISELKNEVMVANEFNVQLEKNVLRKEDDKLNEIKLKMEEMRKEYDEKVNRYENTITELRKQVQIKDDSIRKYEKKCQEYSTLINSIADGFVPFLEDHSLSLPREELTFWSSIKKKFCDIENENGKLKHQNEKQNLELKKTKKQLEDLCSQIKRRDTYDQIMRKEASSQTFIDGHPTNDMSVQTCDDAAELEAVVTVDKKDKEELEGQLLQSEVAIRSIQNNLAIIQAENTQLKTEAVLIRKREKLMKHLQQKANELERLFREKAKIVTTTGTNTDFCPDDSREAEIEKMKRHFETMCREKERILRNSLKKEFDEKLEAILQMYKESAACKKCPALYEQIEFINLSRKEDRECVAKLVDQWKTKFEKIEDELKDKEELMMRYEYMKTQCEAFHNKNDLVKRQASLINKINNKLAQMGSTLQTYN